MEERLRSLYDVSSHDCSLQHVGWVGTWSKHSFLQHLSEALEGFRRKRSQGSVGHLKLQVRERWQARITKLYWSTPFGSSQIHLRRRMDNWNMPTLPGHRVQRAVRVLQLLGRRSVPRVQAAYLRTVCDGWCTRRRFQGRNSQCLFGCGRGEDAIRHYAHCRTIWTPICMGLIPQAILMFFVAWSWRMMIAWFFERLYYTRLIVYTMICDIVIIL